LWLDTETFSPVPIKHGAHRYAEEAEVLLVALAVDDEPTNVWDTQDLVHWRPALQNMIDKADHVVIHNSAFDRTVLRHCGVTIPAEKIIDTMVIAMQHSLPGSLGQLCDILGVPQDKAKDKDGRRHIQLFTKPCPKNWKIRRAGRDTHPDDWNAFIEYARLDVDAMRDVYRRLPVWNSVRAERDLWIIDQRVNDRGVTVDRELGRAAGRAFDRASGTLADRVRVMTDGEVPSATQRDRMLLYLRERRGVVTPDLTKATVEKLLKGKLDPVARELLEIRQQASATSPAKYTALIDAASSDGRLRGTIQFCGASRTGRDAGRIFQPQNLPRTPDWFDGTVQELTIEAFKRDCEDILWDNISERCAFAVRGCLIAAPGRKLVIADLSNIEGRVLAWLADEQWKIEAFKLYDRGEGPDLYKVTAGRILGKDPVDVTKEERQTQGKVPELAGGYGGGLGAYRTMGGAVFNAMDDEAIGEIVQAWRRAHPATKKLWYDTEGAVRDAVRNPGESFEVRGLLRCDYVDGPDGVGYARIRLPSGRYLCYRDMQISGSKKTCTNCDGNGVEGAGRGFLTGRMCLKCDGSGTVGNGGKSGQLTYEGVNQYTRKWERLETYYGKLVENVVQAVARDVFMQGMRRAEEAGYEVVLRVHDELVCEVPDKRDFTHAALAGMMSENPSWSIGLPLAAAGFEAHRYRKE
jgi:DNA polymerase